LLKILADGPMATAMGRAGAERVRGRYRLDDTIGRYYELYAGQQVPSRTEAA
jgi:glycosyltransferase involved in cell wall biosynthesis